MSKETVQFVELVRERQAQLFQPEPTYNQYCADCQAMTDHTHRDEGEWEIQRCVRCGVAKRYRVR